MLRRASSISFLVVLALGGCSVPPITTNGTVLVKSDVPIDARVHIQDSVPMRGDVHIAETVPVEGSVQISNATPVPVQGTVTLQGPIQVTIPGLTGGSTGTYVTESLFVMVKENITSGEWVVAVFGEPDRRTPLSDGTEIWRWTYRPLSDQSPLVAVFGGKDKDPVPGAMTTCVQVRDGKVIAKWRG